MRTISVALTTFNGDRYLDEQLQSLAEQTVLPTQLVAVDDGSADRSFDILSSFAESAPFPVRLVRNSERLGYRKNFIKAVGLCDGDLIAFCDQDDIWHSEKLARTQQAFDQRDVLLVYHNSELIAENGESLGLAFNQPAAIFSNLQTKPWLIVPGHAQMFCRSLLRLSTLHAVSLDPYATDQLMPHDQWTFFWASVLGKIVYLPQPLAKYRQHSSNTSGWPRAHLLDYLRENFLKAAKHANGEYLSAKNRAELLSRARGILEAQETAHVQAASTFYQSIVAKTSLRHTIYSDPDFKKRVRALIELISLGAYGRDALFDLPALWMDSTVGVMSTTLGR